MLCITCCLYNMYVTYICVYILAGIAATVATFFAQTDQEAGSDVLAVILTVFVLAMLALVFGNRQEVYIYIYITRYLYIYRDIYIYILLGRSCLF